MMEVFDCSADPIEAGRRWESRDRANAEEARASSRPDTGTGSPAEGDSRGCLRSAEEAGALVRGGVAPSPGGALLGTGPPGTPATEGRANGADSFATAAPATSTTGLGLAYSG